jgi:hypothetical protein
LNPRIDDALKRLDELGPDDLSSKLIELARIPPGTIVAYWGGGAPGGWLLCNGEPVPEGEVYDDLRLILDDEKLPDLRGVFLRGLDLGRGLDQERVLGSFQDDAFKSHDHGLEDKTEVMDHKDQGMRFQMHGSGSGGMGPNRTRIAGSEVETRPKNVAVSFIIKI